MLSSQGGGEEFYTPEKIDEDKDVIMNNQEETKVTPINDSQFSFAENIANHMDSFKLKQ